MSGSAFELNVCIVLNCHYMFAKTAEIMDASSAVLVIRSSKEIEKIKSHFKVKTDGNCIFLVSF